MPRRLAIPDSLGGLCRLCSLNLYPKYPNLIFIQEASKLVSKGTKESATAVASARSRFLKAVPMLETYHVGSLWLVFPPLRGLRLTYPICLTCGIFTWYIVAGCYRYCAHIAPKHWRSLSGKSDKQSLTQKRFEKPWVYLEHLGTFFFPSKITTGPTGVPQRVLPWRGQCGIASPPPNRWGSRRLWLT